MSTTSAATRSNQETTTAPADRRRIEPAHLFILFTALGVVGLNANPISDIDSWWHVQIGREILDRTSVAQLGQSWTTFDPERAWVTTQWLSEVVMARLVDAFGWSGLVWARGIASVAFIGLLAALVLRFGPPRAAACTFPLVAIPGAGALQERPSLVSGLFVIGLAYWSARHLLDRTTPRWWWIAGLTLLWAQFHGLWVLVPATIGLLTLCDLADRRQPWWHTVRNGALLLGATVVAGSLTPAGPAGLVAPFRFSSAASSVIAEWQRTELWSWTTLGLVGLLALVFASWARGGRSVPWSLLIYTAAWAMFAMIAWRNVIPASIMLVPIATDAFTSSARIRRATTSKAERRALLGVVVAVTVFGLAWTAVAYDRIDPFDSAEPLRIARSLEGLPRNAEGELRVFNAYNTAGLILAEGGPGIKLGIDGRTDRYGQQRIDEYLSVFGLDDGWEHTFNEVDPDAVVSEADAPLVDELLDSGWTKAMSDGDYVLLTHPDRS